jgi:spore germination cell wall hydrolase CwlJ-like protein
MLRNSKFARHVPAAAIAFSMLVSAASSGVAAEGRAQSPASAELSPANPGFSFGEVQNQPLPAETTAEQADVAAPTPAIATAPASLAALVAATPVGDEISPEMKCLASAIYYEARSESLSGQLAVGRVIVNRARSGRFPGSYCGVVYQPSQFSFVHGARGGVNARLWHNAVAVAEIAHDGSWQSEAEGALYFHATRVAPNWGRQKVARIENHIFYR